MAFTSLLIHVVTVYTTTEDPNTPDRYGNPSVSQSATTEYARIQGRTVEELLIDRDTRISDYIVFLAPGTAVTGTSEIAYLGNRYRVVGRPRRVDDADGVHHVECDAELVEG